MILFKQKQYVIPEEERFVKPTPFQINSEWLDYNFEFEIIEADSYKNELKQRISPIWKEWRKDLKRIRKEITTYHIYDDDPKNHIVSDTHYYPSESEIRKRYYTSKSINGTDRLMYDIYAPELTVDEETGEQTIYQKIVLLHCIGHTHRNGKKFSIKERDLGK